MPSFSKHNELDDSNPHASESQKHPPSTYSSRTTAAVAAVQHQRISHGLVHIIALVSPLFNMRNSRDFKSKTHPEGESCMYKTHFFSTLASSCPLAAGRFSRSRLQGTQEGRVYLPRKFGPQPGSVACALGIQSSASWFFFKGSCSATPSYAGPWKPRNFSFSLCCCFITPSLKLLSSLLCGSHCTTVTHQALPFVTVTGGASVCVHVCVMFPVVLGNRNENVISRAGQQIGCCAAGR